MKLQNKRQKLKILTTSMLYVFVLSFVLLSCSNNSTSEQDDEGVNMEEPNDKSPSDDSPNEIQTCDDTSDFPNLGPSATQSQSCQEVSNPNNQGTLDCRTDNAVGGYENLADGWGSYKITGGTIRYDGTKTRVERFFNNITHGNSKKTILSGSFRIYDLSDGNTCIVQSHAGGDILKGEEAGKANRSAQFLIYARKTSEDKIMLEAHVTVNPYTMDTGGGRDVQNFKIINYGEEYMFEYETGYDASGTAFSKILVGDTEKYITHNHTTERVYSRYGAYGSSDSGDVTAHIEFKDIKLCRE